MSDACLSCSLGRIGQDKEINIHVLLQNKLPERRSKQKRSRPGQRGAVSTLKGYSLQDGQSKEEVEGAQADYESRQKRSRKQSEKIQDNDEGGDTMLKKKW